MSARDLRIDINHPSLSSLIQKPKSYVRSDAKRKQGQRGKDKKKRTGHTGRQCNIPQATKLQIYWIYHYSGMDLVYREIAALFGVDKSTVSKICRQRYHFETMLGRNEFEAKEIADAGNPKSKRGRLIKG